MSLNTEMFDRNANNPCHGCDCREKWGYCKVAADAAHYRQMAEEARSMMETGKGITHPNRMTIPKQKGFMQFHGVGIWFMENGTFGIQDTTGE